MLDAKIINWMMQDSININQVYRSVEYSLLRSILLPKYKPVLVQINNYYSRHKTAPTYDILKTLLDKSGDDGDIVEYIEAKQSIKNEIGFIVDELKDRYNKYLVDTLVNKASEIEEGEEDVREFNEEVKRILSKTERLYRDDVFSEGNVGSSTQERLDDYHYTVENPDEIMGFLSGYKELDEYTWGVKNSEMLVIGGASSSGKSLLMMNMAINAWLGTNSPIDGVCGRGDGKNILYISLEMSKKQLEQRVDANVAKIKHKALMRGFLSAEEKSRWIESLKFQKSYDKKFYILDMPRGTTMADIESKYESILGVFEPDAVFIDYLQLMKPINLTGQDWMDVGRVSEEMHEFCRKKNIPVVTAAQRKAAQKKANGKKIDDASLEDLGRSKMIGDNSAIVLMIGNREDEMFREDMELFIVKNRDGARGKVSLRKVFDQSRLESFPDDWVGDGGEENEI